MTPVQIQAAYRRAKAVIDGFSCPSEQNARDVVNLLKHFNSLKAVERASSTQSFDMPDFLKEILGGK